MPVKRLDQPGLFDPPPPRRRGRPPGATSRARADRAAPPAIGDARPRPFLKWAGGKGQLLPELLPRLPATFGAYHEPFVGGGALFFELFSAGRLGRALLSDRNPGLIDVYTAIRDDVAGVIAALRRHRNDSDHFYAVRALDPAALSPVARAARSIFLNKTCFNGLWRENASGRFNVPFGRNANPTICDEPNLRAVSRALAAAELRVADFAEVADRAAPGDLVYFDPPYVPVSASSSFTAYHKEPFGPPQQEALRDVFGALAARGVHVVLSNSDVPFVRELYADFRIDRIEATRSINCRADRRGAVGEVVVRGGPGVALPAGP
jgi:DNA adenine methylase